MNNEKRIYSVEKNNKVSAIIKAATQLFLKNGYAGTSVDDIAAAACVAKQTLYNKFSGKEELFLAIINERCEKTFHAIGNEIETGKSLAETLTHIGKTLLDTICDTESVALYRIIIAETGRHPALGKKIFAAGHSKGLKIVSELFTKHGIIPEFAPLVAENFLGLLTGSLHDRVILDTEFTLTREDMDARITQAAEVTIYSLPLYTPHKKV